MKCVTLNDVHFSPSSINAIKEIRRQIKLHKALSVIIPAGSMMVIFLGNGALQSAYNIAQTDFESLAQGMSSLRLMQRRAVRLQASMQVLETSGKEKNFWEGVLHGCNI